MNMVGNALWSAITGGGTQQSPLPPPPTSGAGESNAGGAVPPTPGTPHAGHEQHKPAEPASWKWRWFLFAAAEALLFGLVFWAVDFAVSKVTADGFYALVIALIGWVILSALAFKLFFRTVGVYQLAHTQDMVTGKLRQYKAGTRLLLPWETLTPDKMVDTEVKVIEIPAIRVHAGDGSPFDVGGKIRYHVAPERSHLYIGVHKPDLELSLVAIAHQIVREEAARYATAEKLIANLPDTTSETGARTPGIISVIGDRFMNGPNVTEIEQNHGVEVDGVPISIAPARETEAFFLKRFEDLRLADSARALQGLEEQARLALLNNPEANFSHTVTEQKQTGESKVRTEIDISGTAGDTLKDFAGLGAVIGNAYAAAKQQRGGGGGQRPKKKTHQQTGGQTA